LIAPLAVVPHLLACVAVAVVTILATGFRRSYHLEANVKSAATCVVKMRTGADMKVNVEIDCTPLEARQFFGLPDVGPMQVAVMDKLQQQMTSNIEKISPESLIQSWFSFDPKLAERIQEMFIAMAGLGGALTGDKKK
jgi:Family of unknown function (DUF6489)